MEFPTSNINTFSISELEQLGNQAEEAHKKMPKTNGSFNKSALGGFQKTIDKITSLPQMAKSVKTAKDSIVDIKAQHNVEKMLGTLHTVQNQEEELLKEFVDTQFSNNGNFLVRVKNSFIPKQLPSGEKITLKKEALNQIKANSAKGKATKVEYTKSNGDKIKVVVSPRVQKQGEDCYMVRLEREFQEGIEAVETRYYPKSSEIRAISKSADGQKSFFSILGNDEGGKVRQGEIKPKGKLDISL